MSIQNINIIIVIVNKMFTQNGTGHQRRTDITLRIKSMTSFSLVKLDPIIHIHAYRDRSQVLLLFLHGIRNGDPSRAKPRSPTMKADNVDAFQLHLKRNAKYCAAP